MMLMEIMSSFNRDIVECKVMSGMYLFTFSLGFNRDIVECKVYHSYYTPPAAGIVLIET